MDVMGNDDRPSTMASGKLAIVPVLRCTEEEVRTERLFRGGDEVDGRREGGVPSGGRERTLCEASLALSSSSWSS